MLSNSSYTQIRVHYISSSVLAFKDGETAPFYSATLPFTLPDITSIGIGNNASLSARTSVRVARYDPGWRVDTWRTLGEGFSNLALWEVPLP